MKKNYSKLTLKSILAICLLCFNFQLFSQEQEKCLSAIIHNELMASDPEYAATMIKNENTLQQIISEAKSERGVMAATYRIPVVVHIIHLGEAVGTGTNISNAQVYSAIRTLNDAYRKKPGSRFDGPGVDTGIEFCLAQKDPSGNPTSGILRVSGAGTSDYSTNGLTRSGSNNQITIKALSKWSNTKYYNVWIVSEIDGNNGGSGVQGFAYFPGAAATLDGSVMLYNSFGYDPTGVYGYNLKSYTNLNSTFIHEMGHALNLYHTFEGDGTGATCPTNTTCTTQGDRCCDIPPHMRTVSTCVADNTANSCQSGSMAVDYQHNYMDYSSDDCQNMFSPNQSSRVNATLATGGGRASLATAANLTACGCDIPVILFSATPLSPCLGIPVQFVDESLNFPTAWNWTFNSGTPGTATAQNPSTTYNTAGTYNVSLKATTASGTNLTVTKTAYINATSGASLPFTENFEGTFPPIGWSSLSDDAPSVAWGTFGVHKWEQRPAVGNTGSETGCAGINLKNYNFANIKNHLDYLISKPINLSGMSVASMTFKVAYKYFQNSANYDTLKVLVSIDCGSTYGPAVYKKQGNILASNGVDNTAPGFTPSVAADWKTETVDLTAYAGKAIVLKFISTNKYGNNLYIDDINVTGTAGNVQAANVIAITSGTNPTCAGSSLTFTATPTNGGTTPAYQWQVNGSNAGTNSPTFTTSTLTNTQTVTCIMTSNMPGVTGSPTTSNGIVMTVNPNPSPSITGNSTICNGSSTTLTTSGGGTYSWNTGASSASITVSPTTNTTYSVTVTNSGCSALATAAVTVNPKPTPSITGTLTICNGSSTTLTTSGGGTYSWNTGASTSSITVSPTTNTSYSVTVTNSGCTALTTTAVTVKATPATPTITQNGTVLTSSSATGNQWYLNGNLISGATNQNYTVTSNGNYTVVVTVNGCPSASSAPKNVTNTDVSQIDQEYLFTIYPNPNEGNFNISFNSVEKSTYRLEIKNTLGQLIYQETLADFNGSYNKQIDITPYGKGIYMISLTNSKNDVVKKIMVY